MNNSKKEKVGKGHVGYISHKKKTEAIRMVIMFAVPLALFIAGMLTTKSRLNVLTIVAVLGMLPASKSLVSLIMYLKSSGITDHDYENLKALSDSLTVSYDNVFTTYEKTYEVPSLVVRSGNVCGYVTKEVPKLAELEKHIETCIKKEGISVNVKIFSNIESYRTRLQSIQNLEETDVLNDQKVLTVIHEITL